MEELLCLTGCWIQCWSHPALTMSCQSCAVAHEGLGSRSALWTSWTRIPVLAPWFVLSWSWTWCCSLSAVAQSGHDWSVLLHGTIPRTLLQFLILLPHSSAGEYMPYSSLVFNPLPAPLHPPALSCPSPALPNSLLTSQTPHV